MRRHFILVVALSLLTAAAYSAQKGPAQAILAEIYELSSTVMRDFARVTITSEPAHLVLEADASVSFEVTGTPAGPTGRERVASAGRHGFILRFEHREYGNSLRRTAEQDRGDYVEYSTKIILSQEKAGESTDIRAEVIFLDYQLGKEVPESFRKRISKLIEGFSAFDVKNKKS